PEARSSYENFQPFILLISLQGEREGGGGGGEEDHSGILTRPALLRLSGFAMLLDEQVSVGVLRSVVADPPPADEPSRAAGAGSAAAAVSPQVRLALTALYTALYSLLFFFVYSQLWLILHYGHKRLSYRSVFLFLCLLWSALRTTLFSFYFRNVSQASQLQPLPFWLLYCSPVCLQFSTLCLLNLYFAQERLSQGTQQDDRSMVYVPIVLSCGQSADTARSERVGIRRESQSEAPAGTLRHPVRSCAIPGSTKEVHPKPSQYNQNTFQYNRNTSQYNLIPSQYNQKALEHNQNPLQYNTNPSQYKTNPSQYNTDPSQNNTNPSRYNTNPSQYNQISSRYNTNPSQYNQISSRYNTNPSQYNQISSWYNTNPSQYNQISSQYNTNHSQYNQISSWYNTNPSQYNQISSQVSCARLHAFGKVSVPALMRPQERHGVKDILHPGKCSVCGSPAAAELNEMYLHVAAADYSKTLVQSMPNPIRAVTGAGGGVTCYWMMCKAKAKYSPELSKYKMPLRLAFLLVSIFFLVVNVSCSLVVQIDTSVDAVQARQITLARVLINDSLFVLCAISLATCICKLAKMSSANVYLESKGTTVCQATTTGAVVVLLYTSRACYNLAVVAASPKDKATPFSYGWYSFSDQADLEKISSEAYVVFGVVLFFWEFVPTTLLVVFFRVQRPNQNLAPGGMITSHSFNSRAYFFDNPRRYDSDDDLPRSVNSRGERGSSMISSTPQMGASWYGSIQRTGSLTGAPHLFSGPQTSTAPLLLAYGNIQTSQHHNYYSTPQDYYSTPQSHYVTPQI
ncbi:hypothetical protein NFI96_022474, partial [Prochilodus magdalenae]